MANIKTYDILQCSRLFPTVNGANNPVFLPYINQTVRINNDSEQSYTVKENIQARFFAPTSADVISNVQYSVESIVFNGLECLLAPANLTVEEVDNIYVGFPLYLGNPTGYTNNLANAVDTVQSLISTAYFERNFIDFMQGLFNTLNMSVEIKNSHPDWWSTEAFPTMRNFMLEMYSSDSIVITITETYNGTSRVLMYEVDGTGATAYIDGVDVTILPVPVDEQPQFGDVYSINSFVVAADPIIKIDCCPVVDPFYASLKNSCESTLNTDCDCKTITFSDNSNYDNGLLGHDPLFFNHRTITLTRPDGSEYIWSTDAAVGSAQVVDQIIAPHWNSNNMFGYNISGSDTDGIYEVKICTYPDWQDDIYYDESLNYFVYRSGIIYKQVASGLNVDPELDVNNDFWIEATINDDRGRYCAEEKIVILCISIMDCYKKAVNASLCDIKLNPCKGLSDNPLLLKAMKMRVTLDALEWAVCDENWDLAEEHIAILKSICCCNG
tara:strand:+ start:788 stop:2278 length:1491 start_codon:yes stop_codon:yes gene_type:complete